jgi:hypothetical protein
MKGGISPLLFDFGIVEALCYPHLVLDIEWAHIYRVFLLSRLNNNTDQLPKDLPSSATAGTIPPDIWAYAIWPWLEHVSQTALVCVSKNMFSNYKLPIGEKKWQQGYLHHPIQRLCDQLMRHYQLYFCRVGWCEGWQTSALFHEMKKIKAD